MSYSHHSVRQYSSDCTLPFCPPLLPHSPQPHTKLTAYQYTDTSKCSIDTNHSTLRPTVSVDRVRASACGGQRAHNGQRDVLHMSTTIRIFARLRTRTHTRAPLPGAGRPFCPPPSPAFPPPLPAAARGCFAK